MATLTIRKPNTSAIKAGIVRWLKRNTIESWAVSGELDRLRVLDKRNDIDEDSLCDEIEAFALTLWHTMDAAHWLRQSDCKSPDSDTWFWVVTELVEENAGNEWL